jgi:hypothetical protein
MSRHRPLSLALCVALAAAAPAVAQTGPSEAASPTLDIYVTDTEGGKTTLAIAHYIKISARADGSFRVTNTRNGFAKEYGKR